MINKMETLSMTCVRVQSMARIRAQHMARIRTSSVTGIGDQHGFRSCNWSVTTVMPQLIARLKAQPVTSTGAQCIRGSQLSL